MLKEEEEVTDSKLGFLKIINFKFFFFEKTKSAEFWFSFVFKRNDKTRMMKDKQEKF